MQDGVSLVFNSRKTISIILSLLILVSLNGLVVFKVYNLNIQNQTLEEKILIDKKTFDETYKQLESVNSMIVLLKDENRDLVDKLSDEMEKVAELEENKVILEQNVLDLDEGVTVARSTFWMEYEKSLNESSNLKGVISLYRHDLDGANSEAYNALIYTYYHKLGTEKFLTQLEIYGQKHIQSGVLECLLNEMHLIYENAGEIDLETYEEEIQKLVSEKSADVISHRKEVMAIWLLSGIKEIIKK